MSKKENTTLRIEPELKEKAAALFRSLGMDLSTATRVFYIQALRCHGLPFEVKLDDWHEESSQENKSDSSDQEESHPVK